MTDVSTILYLIVIFASMLAIGIIDAKTRSIPDIFTGVLALTALGYHFSRGDLDWTGAALGVAFFGLQWGLSRGKWVGSGDVFLGIALGILVGSWREMALTLMIAYAVGALLVSVLIGLGKMSRTQEIAFGPFLVLGAFVAFVFGEKILTLMLPVA